MADITAKMVSELRQKTGAGMMDCKKALQESDGNIEKASEWLRQKGIASAEKKSGKTAAEGLVGSYIHTGGRVGVMVEVNCQTDFVARNEAFKALVQNVAMQIAACPNVEYVKVADIPAEIAEREKSIEMGRDDLGGKPDNIKEKIVAGRIEKRLKEMCLLDQPYVRDQNITVEEMIKQQVAALGENIQVRRFVRFVLGEGIEVQQMSFADEVAAQTGAKPAAEAPKAEEPAAEAPKAEEPAAEAPKAEEPTAEAPKAEEPAAEVPKAEAPKAEEPKAEAPKAEAPKAEAQKAEAQKKDKGFDAKKGGKKKK